MDPKLQTSFIPKKALTNGSSIAGGINLLSLIASIIFLLIIISSVAVYFYSRSLDSQIQTSVATLKQQEDAFDPDTIASLIRLDTRIQATKQILASHVAITPLFDTLEKTVLRSIRFSDLTFTADGSDKINLAMDGQALSYASIAYESDVITQNSKLILNPVFSDLNLDQSGNITFKFTSTLNPLLISYQNNLNSIPALPASTDTTNSNPPSDTATTTAGGNNSAQ